MKTCIKCGKTKPLSEFRKNKLQLDGHNYYCKECAALYYYNDKQSTVNRNTTNSKKKPHQYWASKSLNRHKEKGYIINVTLEEVTKLAKETTTCRYCGCGLEYYSVGRKKAIPSSPSIDRTDNGNEMNINNIQIICHECNSTKRTRTHDEFIKYCSMIHNKFLSV